MYKKIEMQQLVKQGLMDQNDIDDMQDEEVFNNAQNAVPASFFGFDYNYGSDTDDE